MREDGERQRGGGEEEEEEKERKKEEKGEDGHIEGETVCRGEERKYDWWGY